MRKRVQRRRRSKIRKVTLWPVGPEQTLDGADFDPEPFSLSEYEELSI